MKPFMSKLSYRKRIFIPALIAISLVLFLYSKSALDVTRTYSKPKAYIPAKRDSFEEVSLLFAGDVMAHLPQIEAARTDSFGHFDFSPEFQYVSSIIKKADISV